MSATIQTPGGLKVLNQQPEITKYFNNNGTPYTSLSEVLSQITSGLRHIGLTVNINNVEYWFENGILDSDLVEKNPIIIQEQSNWNESLTSSVSYIKNKPDLSLYQPINEKNQSNGYPGLIDGKIDINQLPDSVVGNVKFQGLFNPNTDTFIPSPSNLGWYYIISVDGTYSTINFSIGDWIISEGTFLSKIDNTDALLSFNGRIGNIILNSTDIGSVLNGTGLIKSTGGTFSYISDNSNNWNIAYDSRISSVTTIGNSGSATFSSNILNIPNYTLIGLGGQSKLNGTGYVKMNGNTVIYDNIDFTKYNFRAGTDWQSSSALGTYSTLFKNIYGNGIFLVFPYFSNTYLISYDGIKWIEKTLPFSSPTWINASFINGMFLVAQVSSPSSYAISYDGVNWNILPSTNIDLSYVAYGNGIYVAMTYINSSFYYTSTNGTTWTERSSIFSGEQVSGINFNNGLFVVITSSGTKKVITSTDGINWTNRTVPQQNSFTSITYGNGLFVAVSSDGVSRVMISSNGISWTAVNSTEQNYWQSITYGNGLFVAISQDGNNRIMTSPDGTTWTARNSVEQNFFYSITYGNGLFVAVSVDGTNNLITSGFILNDLSSPKNLLPNSSLTMSSPYNGNYGVTIGLNLSNSNTWLANQIFTGTSQASNRLSFINSTNQNVTLSKGGVTDFAFIVNSTSRGITIVNESGGTTNGQGYTDITPLSLLFNTGGGGNSAAISLANSLLYINASHPTAGVINLQTNGITRMSVSNSWTGITGKLLINVGADAGYTAFDFNGTGRIQGAFDVLGNVNIGAAGITNNTFTVANTITSTYNSSGAGSSFIATNPIPTADSYLNLINKGASGQAWFIAVGGNNKDGTGTGTGIREGNLRIGQSLYGSSAIYVFKSTQNVGIGPVTTDAGYKLSVLGTSYQTNPITVSTASYNVPMTLFQGDYKVFGVPNTFASMSSGGMVVGTYTNVSVSGGSGTGLTVTVVVSAVNFATIQSVTSGSEYYFVGEVVSIPNSSLGGTTGTQTTTILQVTSTNSLSEQNAPLVFRNYITVGSTGAEVNSTITPVSRFEVLNRSGSVLGSPLLIGMQWAGGSNPYMTFKSNNINMITFGTTQPIFNNGFTSNATTTFTSTVNLNGTARIVGKITQPSGTNQPTGTASLTLGTITISNSLVTTTSLIFLSRNNLNLTTTIGYLGYTSSNNSFTINSYRANGTIETNDLSTINYWIIN